MKYCCKEFEALTKPGPLSVSCHEALPVGRWPSRNHWSINADGKDYSIEIEFCPFCGEEIEL